MVIFNWIADNNPDGKIEKFRMSYDNLNWFEKAIWWIMFINWIPMAFSVALLIISAVILDFNEDSDVAYRLLWSSVIIVAIVFLPWIIYGLTSLFRK